MAESRRSEGYLPLFPLHTVLMPMQRIPLRIFEPRYLDLMRRVGDDPCGFGVALIVRGGEVGPIPEIESFGCCAAVVDFESQPDGLLGITIEGSRRLTIHETQVEASGLLTARVTLREEIRAQQTPPEWLHEVGRLIEQQFPDALRGAVVGDAAAALFWRVVSYLPLTNPQKMALLKEDSADERVSMLHEMLFSPSVQ
ncbi:LON peptidase substrate-binding domain-containing protein [Magnetofaba australis]|uniref:Putative peptidase S16, lon domain-containing protein n=1 Tax=Magnetofaba australis IT-1 TaxID=1434232 RepID=A0A1Y2K6V4_9PROT|nr:LON peptidase substrate-binding domain-containing protein [Magnetofaba australis]OSM05078.1 putative peptidase S16, lon domain-containing protein [Magnetofaba australis IT-1]